MNLREICQRVREKAEKTLYEEKRLVPMMFGFTETRIYIVPLNMGSDKRAKVAEAITFLRSRGVKTFVMVFESWVVIADKDLSDEEKRRMTKIAPSENPLRREALTIAGFEPGRNYLIAIPFSRNEEEICFDQGEAFDSSDGLEVNSPLLGNPFHDLH